MNRKLLRLAITSLLVLPMALSLSSCGAAKRDTRNKMLVSVRDQRMLLVRDGKPVKSYKVSTSRFGLGSRNRSNHTPLGRMEVARKIGKGAPKGTVFKARRPTGEVVKANAPGRDPIVSRILWLSGKESHNRNTFSRCIYIHGTPEEWRLGSPASFGCIRMSMKDVADLFDRVGEGAEVRVFRSPMTATPEGRKYAEKHSGGRSRGMTAKR